MPSIRKTKKRLKRRIKELWIDFYVYPVTLLSEYLLADSIYNLIKLYEQELQQLKRKKR